MPVIDTVNIYGTIVTGDGDAAADVKCTFVPAFLPALVDDYAILAEFVETTTDSSGSFDVDLISGIDYRLSIYDIGLYSAFKVPTDTTSANLFGILSE